WKPGNRERDFCLSLQQACDCSLHMNFGGVEHGNPERWSIAQDQWQFCSRQNEAIDAILFLEPLSNLQQSDARFRQKDSFAKFVHIFLVNKRLLLLVGHNQLNSFPGKNLRKEVALHGEAGAKQSKSLQMQRLHS